MIIDPRRGAEAAGLLYRTFRDTGIHGQKDMPEDILPAGMTEGSLEHLYFITLTVAIDYQRDAPALWACSRRTFEDPATRYLFYPEQVYNTPVAKIITDMQKHSLSKKPQNDAYIWRTVGLTFLKKYDNDPRHLFKLCQWKADLILHTIRKGSHQYKNKSYLDFPFLRGEKIGPLWLRMLRDNLGLSLSNLDRIPIPVDIHVARSTLALGIIRGRYEGSLTPLFEEIRKAWFLSVQGLKREDGSEMIALDVDEPLWHLSKHGCTFRDNRGYCPKRPSCVGRDFCVNGLVKIDSKSSAVVNT